jgi:hypothetical protein
MAPFRFGPPERLVHNLTGDDMNTIMLEATTARASNNSKYKTLFQQARQAAVDLGIDVSAIDNMVHDDNAHASYVFDGTDVKNWLKYEFTTKVAWKREQRLRAGTRILLQLSENPPSPGPTQSTATSTAMHSDATAIQPTAALPTTPTPQQTYSMPPPEYSSSSASSSSSSPTEDDVVVPTKPHCVFEAAKLIQGDYITTAFIYLLSNDERVKAMWKQVFRMARGSYTRHLMVVHDNIPDINYYRETYTSARNNGNLLLSQEIQRQVFQFSCKKLLLEHWGLSGSDSLDVLPKIAFPMRK